MISIAYILQIYDMTGDLGPPRRQKAHTTVFLLGWGESPGVCQYTGPNPISRNHLDTLLNELAKTNMDALKFTAS